MEHTRVNDYDNGENGDNITLDVCVDCTEHYNNNNEKVAQGRKFAYLINVTLFQDIGLNIYNLPICVSTN